MRKIGFATNNHIDIIFTFEKENFFSEAYSYDTLTEMLKDNFILKNNDNIIVMLDEEDILGYAIFHISDDFTDVYKIYVREKNRRQGIAFDLLSEIEKLAHKFKSKVMMVEVRSKNISAINLYEKFGLKGISKREGYYINPSDDALILNKELK